MPNTLDVNEFIKDIRDAETLYNKALFEMALNFPNINIQVKIKDHTIKATNMHSVIIKTSLTQELI